MIFRSTLVNGIKWANIKQLEEPIFKKIVYALKVRFPKQMEKYMLIKAV